MQPSPPCSCHEATLHLQSNISAPSNNLTPSTSPPTSQHPTPSLVLLQGRAISKHWTRITSCPHSTTHLFSPTILRHTTRAIRRILTQYEFFIQHMLNTGPPPYTTTQDGLGLGHGQNPPVHHNTYHFTQYDNDAGTFTSQDQGEHNLTLPANNTLPFNSDSNSTSFIGNQPLEDDEASILFQEAVRQSLMQMSAIIRDIQRAIENRRVYVEHERQMDRMGDDDEGEGMDDGQEAVRTGENIGLARVPDVREMGVLTMRAYELFGALDEIARREM